MNEPPTIRLLDQTEMSVLDRVAEDVFDHDIHPRWCAEFLADPRHHLAVAVLDGQVIGMASAVHYVHPDKPPELWVNEVGVSAAHQKCGIGKKLVQALIAHGRTLGCREAWVLTIESNIPARRLYASAGGREHSAILVSFPLQESNPSALAAAPAGCAHQTA